MRSATKRIIMHSLMSILERKSMDEITVRMVCEKSGVSRQTFYNHYYCLMAVFEDSFREEVLQSTSENSAHKCEIGLEKVLYFCYAHKKSVLHVYSSRFGNELLVFIEKVAKTLIENGINGCISASDIQISDWDVDFLKFFYLCIFMGMLRTYLKSGIKESPYFLLSRNGVMLENNTRKSLDKLQKLENEESAEDQKGKHSLQSDPFVKLFDME